MSTFLLDSSVIIDTINNKKGRPGLLKDLLQQGHLLVCCAVNVTKAWNTSPSPGRLPAWLASSSATTPGRGSLWRPLMLPAVAIHHQLTVITDNLKHYPMKELSLYPLLPK